MLYTSQGYKKNPDGYNAFLNSQFCCLIILFFCVFETRWQALLINFWIILKNYKFLLLFSSSTDAMGECHSHLFMHKFNFSSNLRAPEKNKFSCCHSISQIPHQLVGVPLGFNVTLECFTEAHPTSLNYWTREDGNMIHDNRKYRWGSGNSHSVVCFVFS